MHRLEKREPRLRDKPLDKHRALPLRDTMKRLSCRDCLSWRDRFVPEGTFLEESLRRNVFEWRRGKYSPRGEGREQDERSHAQPHREHLREQATQRMANQYGRGPECVYERGNVRQVIEKADPWQRAHGFIARTVMAQCWRVHGEPVLFERRAPRRKRPLAAKRAMDHHDRNAPSHLASVYAPGRARSRNAAITFV